MNVELKKNRKPGDSGDCRSGLGREFFLRGAAVWISVALFVLLVLLQMVPLPPLVLKHVSPSTYRLYQDVGTLEYKNIEERGKRQKIRREENEKVRENSRLRSDELQRAREVWKRQKSEVRGQMSEGQGLGKDEHRTSNIERPTSNEKMKQRAEERGKDEHRTSNIERPTSNWKTREDGRDPGEMRSAVTSSI
jgi:hypothetical protein